MRFQKILAAAGGLLLAMPVLSVAVTNPTPVQIELSHHLDEERAEKLEPLIEDFNKKQNDVRVTLVRRGETIDPKQLNLVTRD